VSTLWPPSFVFAACQHGAESTLKRELATRAPELRPAFSRPGFVTFKLEGPCAKPDKFALPSVFARTWGFSLGSVEGDRLHDLVKKMWELPDLAELAAELNIAGLHVWERDPRMPGDDGFEPGESPLSAEVEQAVAEFSPWESLRLAAAGRTPGPPNRWVLDVGLIEPDRWFVGVHRTASRVACWAGGVPRVDCPPHAVSRAYLKMAEAMAWSALPMSRGERVAELGCAPGGASQALLDAGLDVLGLDPANVDEAVVAHPRFTHVRLRAAETPRKLFKGIPWLAADMNVAPAYTLDAVEAVVKHPAASVRGMILTLKLSNWNIAGELPNFIDRVRSWGYQDVRVRQLAFNRQEVCLAALRSRSQRRVLRTAAPQFRRDRRHASVPAPHDEKPQM
jgi:23S rRNA (cytidine2498-2'-O)-methyltransferase